MINTLSKILEQLTFDFVKDKLVALHWQRPVHMAHGASVAQENALRQQLAAYAKNPRFAFTVPLDLSGVSDFQRRVLAAIARIPVGQTESYGAIARELGTAARAVGQACRRNPLPIIIPCHRVLAANGLGGYSGSSTAGRWQKIKLALLQHEGAI